MRLCRPYRDNRKLPVFNTLAKEDMTHMNVLNVRRNHRVFGQKHSTIVSLVGIGSHRNSGECESSGMPHETRLVKTVGNYQARRFRRTTHEAFLHAIKK